jgi:hypothetical protein
LPEKVDILSIEPIFLYKMSKNEVKNVKNYERLRDPSPNASQNYRASVL